MGFQDFGGAARAAGGFKKPFNQKPEGEKPEFGGGFGGGDEKQGFKKPEFKKPEEDEGKEKVDITELAGKITELKELADKSDNKNIKALVEEIDAIATKLQDAHADVE